MTPRHRPLTVVVPASEEQLALLIEDTYRSDLVGLLRPLRYVGPRSLFKIVKHGGPLDVRHHELLAVERTRLANEALATLLKLTNTGVVALGAGCGDALGHAVQA